MPQFIAGGPRSLTQVAADDERTEHLRVGGRPGTQRGAEADVTAPQAELLGRGASLRHRAVQGLEQLVTDSERGISGPQHAPDPSNPELTQQIKRIHSR